jgi:hypothetical protein
VTGHNIESWVTAVEGKLCDISITTPQMVVTQLHSINPRLSQFRHVPMFACTLGLMAQEGAKEMRNGSDNEMIALLQAVATAKNITGQDVMSWVTRVHNKLRSVGINTVKDTVSGSMGLNKKLHKAGFQMMHCQTLDLLAKKGINIITAPPPPSVKDKVVPLKPLSSNGVVFASDDAQDGRCPECNNLGPPGLPCTTNQCSEEGIMYLFHRDGKYDKSHIKNCPACNNLGPSGDPCVHCNQEGVTFLNFLAGL